MRLKIVNVARILSLLALIFLSAVAGVAPLGSKYTQTSFGSSIRTTHKVFPSSQFHKGITSTEFELIQQYSAEFGLDFRLVLALINQESRFDEEAVSDHGAAGLMQIMPVTHAELSEKLDLQDSPLPKANLIAGIYYFAKLVELFQLAGSPDWMCLALAAYNAGPSRIYDAQELAAYIGENPNSWSAIQNILPLLSKRYYSLHQSIWETGKPRNGYFGSWRQTLSYVENIRKTYQRYKEII